MIEVEEIVLNQSDLEVARRLKKIAIPGIFFKQGCGVYCYGVLRCAEGWSLGLGTDQLRASSPRWAVEVRSPNKKYA